MIENENKIKAYLHCSLCIEEVRKIGGMSPKDYARTQFGWTKRGIQVWCNRHNCNIIHIDFEGEKHPANTTRKKHD